MRLPLMFIEAWSTYSTCFHGQKAVPREVTLSYGVCRYDEKLQNLHKGQLPPPAKTPPPRPPLPTQQFGVSLQ